MCNDCGFDDKSIEFGPHLVHTTRRNFGFRDIAYCSVLQNGRDRVLHITQSVGVVHVFQLEMHASDAISLQV